MDSELKPEFYSLFCGVFLYKKRKPDSTRHVPWTNRLNTPKTFFKYLGRTYYQSYLNNIFIDPSEKASRNKDSLIEHSTVASLLANPFNCTLELKEELQLTVPYFDCFLFPQGIGIFCFKVEFPEGHHARYESISQVLARVRNPQCALLGKNGGKHTVLSFIQQHLEGSYELPTDWNRYVPQLKYYCVVNDPSVEKFDAEMDRTLFELAHAMAVGTIRNGFSDKPTDAYLDGIMKQNSIFIYDNWKAICLLDSFTRVSCSFTDSFKTWELEYFHIYVHCLYSKFQLYLFNSQLTDVLQFNKKTKIIRDRFIEFVNDFSMPCVSYKFLPNLLFEKMTSSLEINREQAEMDKKVDRLNEAYQNKVSKQMNSLLLFISLLSLFSVLNDFSQWLSNMGTPINMVYSPFSIGIYLVAIGASAWLLFRNKR